MPRNFSALFAVSGACAALFVALLASCASTPQRIGSVVLDAAATAAAPAVVSASPAVAAEGTAANSTSNRSAITVHGAQGPVAAGQQARDLQRLRTEGRQALLDRQLQALVHLGDVDLYRGNQARLLVDGPATFAAMKMAIAGARERVLLESYIVEDRGAAAEVVTLLKRKAAEGVQVALVYDAIGSIDTPAEDFDALAAAGVAVCQFNPLDPTHRPGHWGIDHRTHRKLLVVDHSAAFTGGINISRVYGAGSRGGSRGASGGSRASGGSGGSVGSVGSAGAAGSDAVRAAGVAAAASAPLDSGWRDTQIELRGPVVPALAALFQATWQSQGCPGALRPVRRTAAESGPRVVKVLASDPRDARNRIYDALLLAINEARESVQITMAYFAPGAEFMQALTAAARRGVAVELLLPGTTDFMLVLHAGRAYYAELLAAGVRIHEMDHAVMHAKTAVVDGVWSTVGSTNLDWRSIVNNNELNVIVLGDDFGERMRLLFDRDRAASREVLADQWHQRSILQRLRELMGRIAEPWL